MRLVRRIVFSTASGDEDAEPKSWLWYERPRGGDGDGSKSAIQRIELDHHTNDVTDNAVLIARKLGLPESMQEAVRVAGRLHDLGKSRPIFQKVLGNFDPNVLLAKSGGKGGRIRERYRHEFGSLVDAEYRSTDHPDIAAFRALDADMRELVLHLIAAHHGRGRPHFPADADEAYDPNPPPGADPSTVASEVPRRFARLQRRYGRWGLAYLESLLRAADYAASASPSKGKEVSE